MTLKLLYFAWVREQIGCNAEQIPLPAPGKLSDVVDALAARSDGHAQALANRSRLRTAINGVSVGWDAIVRPGDELAIFPPVTGGADV